MTHEVPAFFVPAARPDNLEATYAGFANWCDRPTPPPGERIYSITFIHDGEQWTATVGQQLRGIQHKTKRSRGRAIEHARHLSEPALVLAILPGNPFVVVTNHRFVPGVRSAWENPFFVGNPTDIIYFPSRATSPTEPASEAGA